MRLIPPELTTAILTALSIGSAWFATWLARRGKREDNQIAEKNQAFSQLKDSLAAAREDLAYQRQEASAARAEKARLEVETREQVERARAEFEARWQRQLDRCRGITNTATQAIIALQSAVTPTDQAAELAEDALDMVRRHDQADHSSPPDTSVKD